METYLERDNVVLIFSVNESRNFYGFARVESLPDEALSVGHFGPMEQRFLGPCFRVRWLCTQVLSFDSIGDLANPLNGNLPVKSIVEAPLTSFSFEGRTGADSGDGRNAVQTAGDRGAGAEN